MKLRIRGESLRFRLTQSEVASLHEQGCCQESVTLGVEGVPRLAYRVETSEGNEPGLRFTSGSDTVVTVLLPREQVAAWAGTDGEVGIYFTTAWATKVAIEKDFRCLDEARDEDESDNFVNPNAGTSLHGECRVQ